MASKDLIVARYREKVAAVGGDLQQGPDRRDIPKDHAYDPKSLKPLAKALWAASVAMGHALTSYRHLTRLKSATISPDGKLGGKGYVLPVSDIRKRLYEACESLSVITDTLHDEITAPHWKSRLSQLDENEAEDVERFVEESKGILDNPEEDAQESEKEIEEENDGPKGRTKEATSSIPVGALPGPRVETLNREEDIFIEDWADPKEYPYTNPADGNNRQASSSVPDANTDPTPTEAWDFGLGFGAKGQGAGGYGNPSGGGKGVWGPHSGLPGAPTNSVGDTNPLVEKRLNDKSAAASVVSRFRQARYLTIDEVKEIANQYMIERGLEPTDENARKLLLEDQKEAESKLPGNEFSVARSDYYDGDLSGNTVNVVNASITTFEELSNWASSVLPSEAVSEGVNVPSMMNTDYVQEDVNTPYVRYDYTTHNYRKDPLHDWPKDENDV